MLLTWPSLDYKIGTSFDDSWIVGLHLASHRGLEFGRQIIWTYGPLGFLTLPRLTFFSQGLLSFAYVALVLGSVAVTLVWAARRSLPTWAALPMAAAGAGAVTTTKHDDVLTGAVVAAAAIWALAALDPGRPPWLHARGFPLAAGAVCGLMYLVRPSAGLAIVVAFLIACGVTFAPRRAAPVAIFAGSFAVSVLTLGVLGGQSPASLLDYGWRSFDLMLGYADGLGEEIGPGTDYVLAAVAFAVVAALAWRGTAGWPTRGKAAAFAVCAVILFAGFKQSFIQHQANHVSYYFACALGLGFGSAALRRGLARPLAGLIGLLALYFGVTGFSQAFGPARSLGGLRDELAMLAQPRRSIAAVRRRLRKKERLDAATLRALRGATVHVWPRDTAVVWAYPWTRWDPLPVFQATLSFTTRADREGARMLASSYAPRRILRAIKDEPAAYSPATRLSLFCHYRQVLAGNRWQVLARGRNRCGAPRLIASLRSVTDRAVAVPPPSGPNQLVVARFHGLGPSLGERIQGLAFKGPRWTLSLVPKDREAEPRLAVGVSHGPFLLKIPAAIDYPSPFRFAPNPERLVVSAIDPLRGRLSRRLTVDFLAVSVD